MEKTPGVFTASEDARQIEDLEQVEERWADSPVGKVRYFVDQEGNLLQGGKNDQIVTNFRLAKLELANGQMSKQLELNTALTQQVVDILKGTRMLVKVISFMAPISKWAVTVGAAVLFFYALLKGKPSIPSINLFDGS